MIVDNLSNLKLQLREAAQAAGRNPEDVQLIAVSKYANSQQVRSAIKAGQKVFAENYLQDAEKKMQELSDLDLDWHFIGKIQSNKAKNLVGKFSLIHSVESLKVAEILNRQAHEKNYIQKILLQVHIGDEESKSGVEPSEGLNILLQMQKLSNLRVEGLMTLPPPAEDGEVSQGYFLQLKELLLRWNKQLDKKMLHLSMGTSHDFKAAIAAGSTMVRIGQAIFRE